MKLKIIAKPGNGCDWHRLILPALVSEFEDIELARYEDEENFEDIDILYFNRDINTSAEDLEKFREQYKFKIVVDLDDYWILEREHFLYDTWQESKYPEKILSYLKIADLITVTNKRLKVKISEICSCPILVIPNSVEVIDTEKLEKEDKLRFMYLGGSTHAPDVALLKGKFKRISDEPLIRDNARFILAGYPEQYNLHWEYMRHIFELTRSYDLFMSQPLDKYMMMYDCADVAIVPLLESTFNSMKSPLKVLEAGSRGLPCIVSKVYPFLELKDAPGILWVEKPNDWLKHIRYFINNRDKVQELGLQLKEYIKENYNLTNWSKKRFENIYSSLY